jgi:acetyltransferase-like isoleucine patch superfamily enzyme
MIFRFKLQLFFVLLKLFNLFYLILFPWTFRYLLLQVTGSNIGRRSCIQNVKFFSFGKLTVGNDTVVNSGCYLDNRRGIKIGNNVVIAHDSKIYTLGHDFNDPTFKTKGSSVSIEDYVVIFSNVLVMPGVTIKKGAVILPGSVVTKDVEEMTVAGGNPAKTIRLRESIHSQKVGFRYWFSI